MGMTIAEKTLARAAGLDSVHPGQYVDAAIDRIAAHEEFYRIHAAVVSGGIKDGLPQIWNRDRIHVILEHHQPALNETQAIRLQEIRRLVDKYEVKSFQDTIGATLHQLVPERHVMPGELALGSDSHSCAWGALNAVSTGMGEHELAYAICFGELWFYVPASIKIVLQGSLRPWADPKDLIFYLAQQYTASFGLYRSLEFTGSGASNMSMSNRLTIATHGVELGAKFVVFDYDEKTEEFLKHYRSDFDPKLVTPVSADPAATYEKELMINLDEIEPLVAKPHVFENIAPLSEVVGTPIQQAQIGSCANGRTEDMRAVANILKGKKVYPKTRLYLQPASWNVYRECMAEGLFDTILDAGGQLLSPGCHLCLGMQGRLGENETCITSTTRNHKGRLGGINCDVYLASPKVVAASAVAGEIVDVREVL